VLKWQRIGWSTDEQPMTRWLITGAHGQLGSDLQRVLADDDVRALGRSDLDVADLRAVADTIAEFRPDVVVNGAAYTAVDSAETDEDTAYRVNAAGAAAVASAVARTGGRLIHVSTDYVFDGESRVPYEVDDPTGPKSVYGRSKLAGEEAIRELLPSAYIVRTAWLYGAVGGNFVKTMARLERERTTVTVVDDQFGAPTWTAQLAAALVALGRSSATSAGIYHCTNSASTSWFGFARAIFEELGADPSRVLPTSTANFPRPAPRPAYSVLSDRAWRGAGLTPLPHWRSALHQAFVSIGDAFRAH
jgi:dTDP-4-dehydrorhamnose reductase